MNVPTLLQQASRLRKSALPVISVLTQYYINMSEKELIKRIKELPSIAQQEDVDFFHTKRNCTQVAEVRKILR